MDSEKMIPKIGKQNVGKIAERIIANELEACGFFVRDLNLEGVSANADLLAIKDSCVWQIQVKGSSYEESYRDDGWWFQYGYCTEEHIRNKNTEMFNRAKSSLRADCVAMVCVRSPFEYQYLLMPVETAEKGAQINLDYGYRPPKRNREAHKPGKVWFAFYPKRPRTKTVQNGLKQEQELLKPYLIDRGRKVDVSQRNHTKNVTSEVLRRYSQFEREWELRESA